MMEGAIPKIPYLTYVNCPHCNACHDTEGWKPEETQYCDFCRKPFICVQELPIATPGFMEAVRTLIGIAVDTHLPRFDSTLERLNQYREFWEKRP